jgi:hypothetical protein
MSLHRRLPYVALALAIFILPRGAQGQDVSGTWTTEVPVRIDRTGGTETVAETATVTITLHQEGENVHGTWQMSALPDRPNPTPRQLTGTMRDGRLTLSDTSTAQVRRGGELPMDVQMINTIELTLNGDQLVGSQSARSVDGSISSNPRPMTATRGR